MGTRSIIILKRRRSRNISLYQHWDGYISGVGDDLCRVMTTLLHKYSIKNLIDMIEDIVDLTYQEEMEDDTIDEGVSVDEWSGGGTGEFKTEMLYDIIIGSMDAESTVDDDYNYKYIVDIYEQIIKVGKLTMPFKALGQGFVFSDFYNEDEDEE